MQYPTPPHKIGQPGTEKVWYVCEFAQRFRLDKVESCSDRSPRRSTCSKTAAGSDDGRMPRCHISGRTCIAASSTVRICRLEGSEPATRWLETPSISNSPPSVLAKAASSSQYGSDMQWKALRPGTRLHPVYARLCHDRLACASAASGRARLSRAIEGKLARLQLDSFLRRSDTPLVYYWIDRFPPYLAAWPPQLPYQSARCSSPILIITCTPLVGNS